MPVAPPVIKPGGIAHRRYIAVGRVNTNAESKAWAIVSPAAEVPTIPVKAAIPLKASITAKLSALPAIGSVLGKGASPVKVSAVRCSIGMSAVRSASSLMSSAIFMSAAILRHRCAWTECSHRGYKSHRRDRFLN